MRRYLVALPLLLSLAACGDATRDLADPAEPIGDFEVGHIGVVAPNLQKLLVSREATQQEWIDAVTEALSQRFDRFEGGKYYHLGVSVEAYSLPPPIIPGKSALALNVTVWDDAARAKMNEAPKQIQIIRLIETRLASTRETQMQWLVAEAAKEIEVWMREMQASDGWFAGDATADDNAGTASVSDDIQSRGPVSVPANVLAATNSAAAATPVNTQ
jgi:hypothetical protein